MGKDKFWNNKICLVSLENDTTSLYHSILNQEKRNTADQDIIHIHNQTQYIVYTEIIQNRLISYCSRQLHLK